MLERFRNYLTRQERISEYEFRASYFRERAIKDSVVKGFFIDKENGVDVVEHSDSSVIALGDSEIEFAVNSDGICFARVEGGKYYPIDTSLSEQELEFSRQYEKLSKSALRRFFSSPNERRGDQLFDLYRAGGDLIDMTFALNFLVQQLQEEFEFQTDEVSSEEFNH